MEKKFFSREDVTVRQSGLSHSKKEQKVFLLRLLCVRSDCRILHSSGYFFLRPETK